MIFNVRSGVDLGSIWHRSGIDLGSIWGRFGIDLESIWQRSGVDLGSVWDRFEIVFEIVLGSIWDRFRGRFGMALVGFGFLSVVRGNLRGTLCAPKCAHSKLLGLSRRWLECTFTVGAIQRGAAMTKILRHGGPTCSSRNYKLAAILNRADKRRSITNPLRKPTLMIHATHI